MLTLEGLKAGDVVIVDGGFDCMEAGPKVVGLDESGELFVPCSHGHHLLGGQEGEDGGLVGISL